MAILTLPRVILTLICISLFFNERRRLLRTAESQDTGMEQYLRHLDASMESRVLTSTPTCGTYPQQSTGLGSMIVCPSANGCNFTTDKSTKQPGWVWMEYYTGSRCSGSLSFVQGYSTGVCMKLLNSTSLAGSMSQYCAGNGIEVSVQYYKSFNCDPNTIIEKTYYPIGGCYTAPPTSSNSLFYGSSIALKCQTYSTATITNVGGMVPLPLQQDAIVYSGYGVGLSTCSSSNVQATTFRAFPKQPCSSNGGPVPNSRYLTCPDRTTTYQFTNTFGQACAGPNDLSQSSYVAPTCQAVADPTQLFSSSSSSSLLFTNGSYHPLLGECEKLPTITQTHKPSLCSDYTHTSSRHILQQYFLFFLIQFVNDLSILCGQYLLLINTPGHTPSNCGHP